jgi:hypothetical protein
MSHANTALTPRQRLRVARLVVDHGWPVSRAAEQFNCSWPTAKRWAERYAAMGHAGMSDRFSRPHRVANRTPQRLVRKVVHLRWKQRLGPVAIGAKLAMPASTVDVKKLGNIPNGGGWRYVGKQVGHRNRASTPARTGSRSHPVIGTAYVHTVINDIPGSPTPRSTATKPRPPQ